MKVVALFSGGKDSLVMLDILLAQGHTVYPVYLYYAHLNYISDRLDKHERFWNIKIDRMEHFENYKAKKNRVYGSSLDTWHEEYKYSKDANIWLLDHYKADKIAMGYKKTDSLIRRGIIAGRKKNNSLSYLMHPVADYNDKAIWKYIKAKKIPFPEEYREGYDHEFSNFMTKSAVVWLIENHPGELENLKIDFPLIESVLYVEG